MDKKRAWNSRLFNEIETQDIVNRYRSGESIKSIKQSYNASPHIIRRVLKEQNIVLRRNVGNKNPELVCDNDYFETIDTKRKAYWLGFLYADGCVSISKYSYALIISLQDREAEKQLLLDFAKDLKSTHSIKTYEYTDGYGTRTKLTFSINSKKLCCDLMEKGCSPRKSLILKFPTVEQVPKDLQRHFVRGYFDGDGSIFVDKDGQYHIGIVGTVDFTNSLKEIAGITTKSTYKKGTTIANIRLGGNNKVLKFLDWLYEDSSVYLSRKYDKYLALKQYKQQLSKRKIRRY